MKERKERNDIPEGDRWYLDIGNIIDRMKAVTGAETDAELARVLNVSGSAVGTWRTRGTIPWELLVNLHHEYGSDLNWLALGQPDLGLFYKYVPTALSLPPPEKGGLRAMVSNYWRWGLNACYPLGGNLRPFEIVSDRKVYRDLVTVPAVDDAMTPILKYYDTATVALIIPESEEEEKAYDYDAFHGQLVCVAFSQGDQQGQLIVRRLLRVPAGYDLVPDNPQYPSYPFIRKGKPNDFTLVGEVVAVLSLQPGTPHKRYGFSDKEKWGS